MCFLRVICAESSIGENNRRGYAERQIEKRLDSPERHTHANAASVLNNGITKTFHHGHHNTATCNL
jgi:hypothetical protein